MMFVAWPVWQALARLLTGENSVPVKYSVHLFRATARMMPIRQVQAGRMSRPGDARGWPRPAGSVMLSQAPGLAAAGSRP